MSAKKLDTLHFGKIGDIHLKMMIPNLEECYPGLEVSEYNLVIAPGVTSKSVGKIGSILLPELVSETLDMAVQVGRIIDMSPLAFNFAKWPEDKRAPPQIGDVVWFAKYAGGIFDGIDGREYRLVKDKDITGVIPAIDQVRLAKVKAFNEETSTQSKVA